MVETEETEKQNTEFRNKNHKFEDQIEEILQKLEG